MRRPLHTNGKAEPQTDNSMLLLVTGGRLPEAMETEGKERGNGRLLLSVPEAAAALGLSRDTIYEMCYSERIPYMMVGKRRMLPVSALQEWIKEHTRPAKYPPFDDK